MNETERKMVSLLKSGSNDFGVVSVKAEFEAEGTRTDELLRLLDIVRSAGLPLTVKIGGCEAVRDLLESKQFGVRYIVAPMVETSYALEKYVAAKNLVYSDDERLDTEFLFNMETVTAFDNRYSLLETAAQSGGAQGVVFGRVDFVGSLKREREAINDDDIRDRITDVAIEVKSRGLDLVVGGGVSIDSIPSLRHIHHVHLTRFETRKVVFAAEALSLPDIEQGLLNAVHFELLWLLNKRSYYSRVTDEDARRIEMLENRWRVMESARVNGR